MIIAIFLSLLFGPVASAATLAPDELLLVYNRNQPASQELASYYARVRQIPEGRLCPVDIPANAEEITRPAFELRIRDAIRAYLREHELSDKVRCLVTFYGLPIRVGAVNLPAEANVWHTRFEAQFREGLANLALINRELWQLAGRPATTSTPAVHPAIAEYPGLQQEYIRARHEAYQALERRRARNDGHEDYRRFINLIEQVEGSAQLLTQITPADNADADVARQHLATVRQSVRSTLDAADTLLARDYADPAREKGRQAVRQYNGLFGYLASLEFDMHATRADESHAAVDSELMLLWWDNYPRYRWMPNLLNWRTAANPQLQMILPPRLHRQPVLMVARIDAPTAPIARRMIDDAIAAEGKGLTGRVYLDARGLAHKSKDAGLIEYDRDLVDLAGILLKNTGLNVRLDSRPALFQRGECPQAMLYCGWYSLRNYIDAFDFVPGAVGFHMASFEAVNLHAAGERGWCANLLRKGAAVTLGPVSEPYLQAFPKPTEFFGLLLTGRFTLAECYSYCLPFTSWQMMMLGDPLYRPFKNNPALTPEQLYPTELIPERLRPSSATQEEADVPSNG